MKILSLTISVVLLSTAANAQVWFDKKKIPTDLAFPVVVSFNGKIHVMGGGASAGATDLHLCYTIATDRWDTMASVPFKAQQPAGALVNGRIHFCGGGFPNSGTRLNKHYIYHPDLDTWYKAADLPVATAIHKAVGFNGKFYIMGGQPDKTMCKVYDPSQDKWTSLNALPDQNFWYGGICSSKGGIYRFGGGGFTAPSNQVHRYDTLNDQWVVLNALPESLHATAAVAINDSVIFIAGGYNAGQAVGKCYWFNTQTQVYTETNALAEAVCYHSLVFENACVFLAGGNNDNFPDAGTSLWMNCNPFNNLNAKDIRTNKPYRFFTNDSKITLVSEQGIEKKIRIYDMNGKEVANVQTQNGLHTFECHSSGVYTLLISISNSIYREKIIFLY